jgi:hypothetical protein
MVDPFRYVRVIGVVVLVFGVTTPASLWAQGQQEGTVRTAGTVTNLFETLDPDEAVDGLRLRLPEAWTLEQVRVLRYGTEPVPVRAQRTDEFGTHLYVMGTPLEGPHDLILRVRLPKTPGDFEWTLQTLARNAVKSDSTKRRRFRVIDRRRHQLTVDSAPAPLDRSNKALSLTRASDPLLLRDDVLPALGRTASFTIEFWVQTHGLDETILSTWNGNESMAYPAEFVVDRGGRLRYYTGRPGEHRALRTGRPVADGSWHHVAAIYDADRSQLQLLFDGQRVDSLKGPLMPPTSPRESVALAIGGRLMQERDRKGSSESLFSGELDELRIWGEARSVQTIRRMRSRSFQLGTEDDAETQPVRLSFDEKESSVTQKWPRGARRVPTTLSFRSVLRNLRARTNEGTVTLQWTADPSGVQAFVVERSREEKAFRKIAELSPDEARRQASVSDFPQFSYRDESVEGQVVFYRIRLKREEGVERTSGTIKIGLGPKAEEPAPATLIGNFPNPFSETTRVAYEVNEASPVTITVWDLQGHRIARLADGMRSVGYHEAPFDARDLPSGAYFVKLETPSETYTHRMVVLK